MLTGYELWQKIESEDEKTATTAYKLLKKLCIDNYISESNEEFHIDKLISSIRVVFRNVKIEKIAIQMLNDYLDYSKLCYSGEVILYVFHRYSENCFFIDEFRFSPFVSVQTKALDKQYNIYKNIFKNMYLEEGSSSKIKNENQNRVNAVKGCVSLLTTFIKESTIENYASNLLCDLFKKIRRSSCSYLFEGKNFGGSIFSKLYGNLIMKTTSIDLIDFLIEVIGVDECKKFVNFSGTQNSTYIYIHHQEIVQYIMQKLGMTNQMSGEAAQLYKQIQDLS